MRLLASCLLLSLICLSGTARGVEHITLDRDTGPRVVSGRVLVTAQDGGVLLQSADGVLWNIEPNEMAKRASDDNSFEPLESEALGRRLLDELPPGFEVYSTRHYVICYDTSRAYAQWCGALLERLFKGFYNYWSRKGFKLDEPEFPLVAVVFASQPAYAEYSKAEFGTLSDAIIGHYSLRTNRVTMYDLTGVESRRAAENRRGSAAQINRMLARPEAELSVATIIHEATHQIAFNSGLQQRYADIPLWVSEGIAVYFETPDLQSSRGWRTIGAVSPNRLGQFRRYLSQRGPSSLESLIADDKRIRDTRTALDAYAEAWALNYYLLNRHPREYTEYLRTLSEKKPLVWDNPQARLAAFRAAFGDDLEKLDADFLRFVEKLR